MRHPGQRGLQGVVFLVRNLKRDMRVARFHLGHPGDGVGHELDRNGVEIGLAAPVIGVGFQPHIGAMLELVDHVGAGADGGGLKALGPDLFVIGLGQDVAGQEIHPFEDRGFKPRHVGGHGVALGPDIGQRSPDELDRVAGLFIRCTGQRPGHILGGEG